MPRPTLMTAHRFISLSRTRSGNRLRLSHVVGVDSEWEVMCGGQWLPIWSALLALLAPNSPRPFQYLSASIAPNRNHLAVYVTVSLAYAEKKSICVRRLYVPETIEWE